MPRFLIFSRKEFLQVTRDRNALILLFVMPMLFILIMSLALQSGFEAHIKVHLDYFFVDGAETPASRELMQLMDETGAFNRLPNTDSVVDMRNQVRGDGAKFLLLIDPDFDARLAEGASAVTIEVAPGTELPLAMLFESQLRQALGSLYLNQALQPLIDSSGMEDAAGTDPERIAGLLTVRSLYQGDRGRQIPTSVQQNVPAWLVFAMFFVSVPLSTTLISERDNGTLARLQTMSFPTWALLLGKLLPYFFLNLCQVILMLLVGIYLVPVFGGDRLELGDAWGGIALMSVAASLAAVSFGLFVAHLVRTTEQATTLTGAANIIMAAIAGVMVPRFLMPQVMQDFAWISPMTWSLEGYLDLFLRGGAMRDIFPECVGLLIFSCIMMSLAISISGRRRGI